MFTGQVFFRNTGECSPDGRRLMSVVGVIAVDDDDVILSEVQCAIVGQQASESIALTVFTPGKDFSSNQQTIGKTLGNLLLSPIWRV